MIWFCHFQPDISVWSLNNFEKVKQSLEINVSEICRTQIVQMWCKFQCLSDIILNLKEEQRRYCSLDFLSWYEICFIFRTLKRHQVRKVPEEQKEKQQNEGRYLLVQMTPLTIQVGHDEANCQEGDKFYWANGLYGNVLGRGWLILWALG